MSGFEKPEEQFDWGAVNVQKLVDENSVLRVERDDLRRERDEFLRQRNKARDERDKAMDERDEALGERDRARSLAVLLEAECARLEEGS